MSGFQFTNDWFDQVRELWELLIPRVKPSKILEVGSYEGASTCYLIQACGQQSPLEIHCIDTWGGGIEHQAGGEFQADMSAVEQRFNHNTKFAIAGASNPVTLVAHKGFSDLELAKLLCEGKRNYFDFIYIDGSHQAPDVLLDAALAFKLLRIGGFMAFDDYLWAETLPYGADPIRCPKPAIDAFTNLNCRKIQILSAPLVQLYLQKTSD